MGKAVIDIQQLIARNQQTAAMRARPAPQNIRDYAPHTPHKGDHQPTTSQPPEDHKGDHQPTTSQPPEDHKGDHQPTTSQPPEAHQGTTKGDHKGDHQETTKKAAKHWLDRPTYSPIMRLVEVDGQSRILLDWAFAWCIKNEMFDGHVRLNRAQLGRDFPQIKRPQVVIQRMCHRKVWQRMSTRYGRGGIAWSEYAIAAHLWAEMMAPKVTTKVTTSAELSTGDRGGGLISFITSDLEVDLFAKAQLISEQTGLAECGIDAREIMRAWKSKNYQSIEQLAIEADHFAFALPSSMKAGVKDAVAHWYANMVKTRLYIGEPGGYKPLQERKKAADLKKLAHEAEQAKDREDVALHMRASAWLAGVPFEEQHRLAKAHALMQAFEAAQDNPSGIIAKTFAVTLYKKAGVQ